MMQEMGILTTDAFTDPSTQASIHLWFTAPELGHPLIDDDHERPLQQLMGPFLRENLSRFLGMDDDDDEMGHLHTGFSYTRFLALSILEHWDVGHGVEENDNASAIPDQYQRRSRERFSTPHTARDPYEHIELLAKLLDDFLRSNKKIINQSRKIDEIELESEDLQGMIRHPPKVGAAQFHHKPESTDTSHAGVTATTFQGTTSVITARGP